MVGHSKAKVCLRTLEAYVSNKTTVKDRVFFFFRKLGRNDQGLDSR